MINLRKMKADEYPAYCDYFIADYGDDLTQNHGHSIEMATKLAQQALLSSFPDGVESKQHDLLCIELNSNGSFNSDWLPLAFNQSQRCIDVYL